MIALAAIGLVSNVAAEETKPAEEKKAWSLDTGMGVYTDYMFRGFNLYDGVSIQPSANFNYDTGFGTVSAGLFMYLPGEGDRQEEKFVEMDEVLKYSNKFGPVGFTLGHIWYSYPYSDDDIVDTNEIYAALSYDTILTPTFTVYEDYREYDIQYYELTFSHKLTPESMGEGFNITPYVTFAFASNADKVYEDDGLEHVTYGFSSAVPLGILTLTPIVSYTSKVDDATVNEFWAGTTVSYTF